MEDVESIFKYENGLWTAIQECEQIGQFTLFLIGDANFMSVPSNVSGVRELLELLEQFFIAASRFAICSLYGPVIDAAGGASVSSVVIDGWDDLRVWLSMRDSYRMVGVRVRDGECVDVYCDH